MRETTTAPLIGWSRTFPATPRQAGEARRFLAAILDGSPAADDTVLCLSELVSNAILHSRSREPGGQLTVRVQAHEDRIRVEVHDEGGPWAGISAAGGQNGRGLLIVDQLARAWGRAGDETAGWITWFEMNRA